MTMFNIQRTPKLHFVGCAPVARWSTACSLCFWSLWVVVSNPSADRRWTDVEQDKNGNFETISQDREPFHNEGIYNSVQTEASVKFERICNEVNKGIYDSEPSQSCVKASDMSNMNAEVGKYEIEEMSSLNEEVVKYEDEEMPIMDDSGIFKVDRTQIEEVQLCEQDAELQILGLTVYDQDTLEKGILQQVDQALEQLDRQQLEQQIKNITDEIETCKQQLKKSEVLLKALKVTGISGQKQAVSVKKNVELKQKQLETLQIRANVLQQRLNTVTTHLNGACSDVPVTSEITLEKTRQQQESEWEHKVRLGEMTPFGNVLASKSTSPSRDLIKGLTEFEKYLQNQAELQKKRRSVKMKKKIKNFEREIELEDASGYGNQKKIKEKRSPLKKSILLPKRKQKIEKLGTHSSEDWWDQKQKPGKLLSEETALADSEGSEYLPSESELEELERKESVRQIKMKKRTPVKHKIRKHQNQDPEEWKSDDSDWDYSDEETRAKRRKSTKKEIDDGNIDEYHERLKLWEEQRAKQPEQDQTGDHELEAGYKLPKALWTKLYNYQKVGVQWLWELNQQKCGGILGDEMGLGKTVQVIAYLAGLNYSKLMSRHGKFRGLGPSLIVCPTTVMHQWVREFHVWWPHFRVAVLHESGSFTGKRVSLIGQMNYVGCILVTSYVGAVQHKDALLAKNWHYVILDEGHKIRNPDAQVTLAVKQFRTPHRLILSGSPMQNNLKELWSLFDFIFPGKLGTLPVFLAQMAVPITQGGYANASEVQVATAYRCATVLRDTIAPYLLRRMKADVKSHIHLPPKNEQVLFCRLTEEQRILYKSYLDSDEVGRILQGRFQVFVGLIALRKICNHPDLYSGGPKLLRGDREEDLPVESRYGFWRRAGKMLVIESLLNIWQKQRHRVLLFTQSRQMLCILEAFVQKLGYKYLKLDGGTAVASRQPLIAKFNEDTSYFVFLLTTRVGGLGVNLTGADRVVIYDPDWNPATDTQARERAWRIGQLNHVTVYRLVTAGTIEEKIYHRQIFKQFLCNKVLRDPRQRRFFKSNDLLELFTLAESERTTETAAIFAGTGSEVKMKYHKLKFGEKKKKLHQKSKEQTSKNIKFSASKLERMKQLAHLLSKQIAATSMQDVSTLNNVNQDLEGKNEINASHVVDLPCSAQTSSVVADKNVIELKREDVLFKDTNIMNGKVVSETESVIDVKDDFAGQNSVVEHEDTLSNIVLSLEDKKDLKHDKNDSINSNVEVRGKLHRRDREKTHRHGKKHRHHKRKHSRRKERDAIFEGERVPYLVGQSEAEEAQPSVDSEERNSIQEDDYVLRKLFKKSGVQTAMRHDTIMEGGDADYALVEGEAQRVARDAVQALKESRRQCWHAGTGVPSWTGHSGALRSANVSATHVRPRFGKKNSISSSSKSVPENKPKAGTSDSSNEIPMSSNEILSRMRTRNRLLEPMAEHKHEHNEEEVPEDNVQVNIPASGSIQEEHMDLLTDIRNFVAFGASVDGRASTQEILAQFSERLPAGSSPLFKFMLSEVCEFHRMPSGEGVWRLRNEFKW